MTAIVSQNNRPVFTRMSMAIRDCFGITLPCYAIGIKSLALTCHPIRSKAKTNHVSLAHVFLCFASATCLCLDDFDWSVITLVLVLRHSIENHSITGI